MLFARVRIVAGSLLNEKSNRSPIFRIAKLIYLSYTVLPLTPKLMAPATRRRGKTQIKNTNTRQRKKSSYVPINFEQPSANNAVIEDLRRASSEISPEDKKDLETEILDQVSLDGLSGITFRRLLTILDAIYPDLKCLASEQVQDHVWKVLVLGYLNKPDKAVICAYYLNPRPKEKKKDEPGDEETTVDKSTIIDKPIKLPKQTSDRFKEASDIMLYPVQDGRVRGSCETYLERVEITQDLINAFQDIEGARECLNIANAKYGIDNIVFVASQNLRFQALVPNYVDPALDIKLREYCTLELIGKSRTLGLVFPNDKQFGRYRILLLAKALICQYQETCSTFVIQHLIRFSPGKKADSFKSIIPKPKVKLVHSEKQELEDEFETPDCIMKNICCNPNRLKVDRDFMKMIYDFIALSESGCTQIDIRKKFRLSKFHIRNHLKNMICLEWVHSKTDKSGDRPLRVYKTVHKSFRRKMLMKEKIVKPSKGVMASWDDRDLKAKKILGHKRSNFSQAEDSFLILCRIASLLLEPNLRKLSYCVNKRVIRDLLHEELIESQNKTSDSCLRRMKYLRRLPSNIMSIDELTAELRDDCDVMKIVNAKKGLQTANEDKLKKLFIHLLRTIRARIPYLLGLRKDNYGSTGSAGQTSIGGATNLRLRSSEKLNRLSITSSDHVGHESRTRCLAFESYDHLRNAYNIMDCQSVVASIARGETYELARNIVDVKLNNVALVTMAFALTSSLGSTMAKVAESQLVPAKDEAAARLAENKSSDKCPKRNVILDRRLRQRMLEKFYSDYPEKLVSSVQSKLNKRSLLVRKFTDTTLCHNVGDSVSQGTRPMDQNATTAPKSASGATLITSAKTRRRLRSCNDSVGRQNNINNSSSSGEGNNNNIGDGNIACPKSDSDGQKEPPPLSSYRSNNRTSLKLNQSVLFLLNRYQSSSLMQLAYPISPKEPIDLSESNEMSSIALLTSMCALSSFEFDLELKIPIEVVFDTSAAAAASAKANRANETSDTFKRLCANEGNIVDFNMGGDDDATRSILSDALIVQPCSVRVQSAPLGAQKASEKAADDPMGLFLAAAESSVRLLPGRTRASSKKDASGVVVDVAGAAAATTAATATELMEVQNKGKPLKSGLRSSAKSSPAAQVRSAPSGDANDGLRSRSSSRQDQIRQTGAGAATATGATGASSDSAADLRAQSWLVRGYRLMRDDRSALPDELVREKASGAFEGTAPAASLRSPATQGPSSTPGKRKRVASSHGGGAASRPKRMTRASRGKGEDAAASSNADRDNDKDEGAEEDEEDDCGGGGGVANRSQVSGGAEPAEPSGPNSGGCNNQVLQPIEYEARLWKTIEGRVHIETLSKLIESLLSWIITFPGIEFDLIQTEFGHLMPKEHLLELLALMKELRLISECATIVSSASSLSARASRQSAPHQRADDDGGPTNPFTSKPCLFGRGRRRLPPDSDTGASAGAAAYGHDDDDDDANDRRPLVGSRTFEPTEGAFIRYAQLLETYLK